MHSRSTEHHQQNIRRVCLGREDKEFICDTIEPPMKELGVNPHFCHRHKSAMPPGRYPVVIMPSKVVDLCLPLIVGVPKLKSKDVRIQIGNSVEDIEVGLIMVLTVVTDKSLRPETWYSP